jgi:hypothetical protein
MSIKKVVGTTIQALLEFSLNFEQGTIQNIVKPHQQIDRHKKYVVHQNKRYEYIGQMGQTYSRYEEHIHE